MLQWMRGERGHSGDGSGNGELTRQSGSVGGMSVGSLLILKLRCGGLSRDVKQEQPGKKSFSSQPPGYRVIRHKCHWLHFYLSSIRVILVPFLTILPHVCTVCSLYTQRNFSVSASVSPQTFILPFLFFLLGLFIRMRNCPADFRRSLNIINLFLSFKENKNPSPKRIIQFSSRQGRGGGSASEVTAYLDHWLQKLVLLKSYEPLFEYLTVLKPKKNPILDVVQLQLHIFAKCLVCSNYDQCHLRLIEIS